MTEHTRPARSDDVASLRTLLDQAASAVRPVRGGAQLLAESGVGAEVGEWVARLAELIVEPTHDDAEVLVATWDDVVVGTVVIAAVGWPATGERIARIGMLWVDPEARGLGLGEALLEAALAWAAEHGCHGLEADALPGDRETKNAFERFGMVTRRLVVFRRVAPAGPEPAGADQEERP